MQRLPGWEWGPQERAEPVRSPQPHGVCSSSRQLEPALPLPPESQLAGGLADRGVVC